MEHLNEEQLVLHHYHDDEMPRAVEQHLATCENCRTEYATLRRVLSLVDELPVPERSHAYGEQVWNRLRWKLGSERRRRRTWVSSLAAAAVLAVAFFAGQLWHARNAATAPANFGIARSGGSLVTAEGISMSPRDRLLLVVVSDHLDNSERMLQEVANADARRGFDITTERKRAEELVATNRIYRQTATQQGDERIAMLLADLEPVLAELAHAGDKLTPDEVTSLQKRIESKGLLFKVRIISAESSSGNVPPVQKGTTSL